MKILHFQTSKYKQFLHKCWSPGKLCFTFEKETQYMPDWDQKDIFQKKTKEPRNLLFRFAFYFLFGKNIP